MMKYIAIALLISTTVMAQEGPINKGETWYRIYPKQTLNLKKPDGKPFYAEVTAGKDLLFEYYMRKDEYAQMSDDEYTEKLIFSVPAAARSFKYTGETLKAAFLRGCFCADRGWHEIHEGTITGKKINSTTWKVTVDVKTMADPSRNAQASAYQFTKTFKLYNPPKKKK